MTQDLSDLYWLKRSETTLIKYIFSYQWLIFAIIQLLGTQGGMTPMAGIFVLYEPNFSCKLDLLKNQTLAISYDDRCGREDTGWSWNDVRSGALKPRCPDVQMPRCQMPKSPETQKPRSPDA